MSPSTSRSISCARRCAGCSGNIRRLDVIGLGQDFSRSLDLPAELLEARPLFFYPGSSIGNFTPDEALAFLRRVRAQARRWRPPDRRRPRQAGAVLEAAYDDALGVTAAFNLNAAAPPQPADRQRLRAAPLAACRASRRGRVADRDAPRGAPRPGRALARRERALRAPASASTPRTRTSTRSRLRVAAAATRASRRPSAGPTSSGWFACSGRPPAVVQEHLVADRLGGDQAQAAQLGAVEAGPSASVGASPPTTSGHSVTCISSIASAARNWNSRSPPASTRRCSTPRAASCSRIQATGRSPSPAQPSASAGEQPGRRATAARRDEAAAGSPARRRNRPPAARRASG